MSKTGVTLEESIQFCKWLEEAGIDGIEVSGGTGEVWEHTCAPTHFPYGQLGPSCGRDKSRSERTNYRRRRDQTSPPSPSRFCKTGKRILWLYVELSPPIPDWANKAAAGRPEEIRPCIRCNDCLDSILPGTPMRCRVNFLEGRESRYELKPARESKKVVVVGGGAAGMEAARTAYYRGHDVTLIEKARRARRPSNPGLRDSSEA